MYYYTPRDQEQPQEEQYQQPEEQQQQIAVDPSGYYYDQQPLQQQQQQQYEYQQPAAPKFHDPLERKPRAIASFGFGGQLVLMFPYQQQRFDSSAQAVVTATMPGQIHIKRVKDLAHDSEWLK